MNIDLKKEMPYPDVLYPDDVLKLLAENIKGPVLEIFKLIYNERKNNGITKNDLAEHYNRRTYDQAIIILESSGFIFAVEKHRGFGHGRPIPYFPTTRGTQLKRYLETKN